MPRNKSAKFILVEGLTGSGKSTLAHFLSNQLKRNQIPARWTHEGEPQHPSALEFEGDFEAFMQKTSANWARFVEEILGQGDVVVAEAAFFNNLLERLYANGMPQDGILNYSAELEEIIGPLNPALVYLTQASVQEGLARNFGNRGERFQAFVIDYTTGTALAKSMAWSGYEGMVCFLEGFVELTDHLFDQFKGEKIKIDNSSSAWDKQNQQVLDFLNLSFFPYQTLSVDEGAQYVGRYRIEGMTDLEIRYQAGFLSINLFQKTWCRLIPLGEHRFEPEGWPFELQFEKDSRSGQSIMSIEGRGVDYLPLLGKTAGSIA